jgi:hypothetical protein
MYISDVVFFSACCLEDWWKCLVAVAIAARRARAWRCMRDVIENDCIGRLRD